MFHFHIGSLSDMSALWIELQYTMHDLMLRYDCNINLGFLCEILAL